MEILPSLASGPNFTIDVAAPRATNTADTDVHVADIESNVEESDHQSPSSSSDSKETSIDTSIYDWSGLMECYNRKQLSTITYLGLEIYEEDEEDDDDDDDDDDDSVEENNNSIDIEKLSSLLPQMTALKKLYIQIPLSLSSLTTLLSSLSNCKSITRLALNNCSIGLLEMFILEKYLSKMTQLTGLCLVNNQIGHEMKSMEILCNLILKLANLEYIDLSGNQHLFYCDENENIFVVRENTIKMHLFVQMLAKRKQRNTLVSLGLNSTNMNTESFLILLHGLQDMKSLYNLTCSNNFIDFTGLEIKVNDFVTSLNIIKQNYYDKNQGKISSSIEEYSTRILTAVKENDTRQPIVQYEEMNHQGEKLITCKNNNNNINNSLDNDNNINDNDKSKIYGFLKILLSLLPLTSVINLEFRNNPGFETEEESIQIKHILAPILEINRSRCPYTVSSFLTHEIFAKNKIFNKYRQAKKVERASDDDSYDFRKIYKTILSYISYKDYASPLKHVVTSSPLHTTTISSSIGLENAAEDEIIDGATFSDQEIELISSNEIYNIQEISSVAYESLENNMNISMVHEQPQQAQPDFENYNYTSLQPFYEEQACTTKRKYAREIKHFLSHHIFDKLSFYNKSLIFPNDIERGIIFEYLNVNHFTGLEESFCIANQATRRTILMDEKINHQHRKRKRETFQKVCEAKKTKIN